ncbi:MAG TPA: HhH-GPD-type base excision DNA repair protein, partial [Ilumatobacteraceae bacterium]
MGTLYITGRDDADGLLNRDGTALLIGMLLDQQVPMEWAFHGPATLQERLGHLDATKIAEMTEDDVVAVCAAKPAIHRFPAAMGRRIHALCGVLAERYDGRGENVWNDVASGAELSGRLRELPGYGDEKARIFVAILGKRMGVRPDGWREAAGVFGDDVPRSV